MGVMLKISGAEKTFGRGTANEHKVLNRLDLELKSGEFVTLLGSNGAGKTTLFNAVCGNFLLDEGSISLDGEDITFCPEHVRALKIGRIFQDPMKGTAPSLTIEENLALAYSKQKRGVFPWLWPERTGTISAGFERFWNGPGEPDGNESGTSVRRTASGGNSFDEHSCAS